jgi:hypothetical protein
MMFYDVSYSVIVGTRLRHAAEHVNALARTSPDGGRIYLAGDSAHDGKLLYGVAKIPRHDVFGCTHNDPVGLLSTLRISGS